MIPWMLVRGNPSRSERWKAWSRFGPTVAFVTAQPSTRQEPHFSAKKFLPGTGSALRSDEFVHALRSVTAPAASVTHAAGRRRGRRGRGPMRAGTLPTPADRTRPAEG